MRDPSYPQRMGQILLQATEEILGEEGLNFVRGIARTSAEGQAESLNAPPSGALAASSIAEKVQELSISEPSRYLEHLERVYGPQCGRGLARRIGRACLPYGLREFGSALGVTGVSFRLLPLPAKLRGFAGALAGLLHSNTGQQVTVEEADGRLLWHVDRCPLCLHRHTSEPACHLAVGIAEEALYWLSGGKIFQVEEIACIARGDLSCTLQIDEMPIS